MGIPWRHTILQILLWLHILSSVPDVRMRRCLKPAIEGYVMARFPNRRSRVGEELRTQALAHRSEHVPALSARGPLARRADSRQWRSGRCTGRGHRGLASGSTAEGKAAARAKAPPRSWPRGWSVGFPSRSRCWRRQRRESKRQKGNNLACVLIAETQKLAKNKLFQLFSWFN